MRHGIRACAYPAGVAVRLAEMLGAPALLSCFSRLLIDPNRGLDDPTLIMQISDGLIVPGNVSLSESEVASRIAFFARAIITPRKTTAASISMTGTEIFPSHDRF